MRARLLASGIGEAQRQMMNTNKLISAAEQIRDAYPPFRPKLALIMGSGWREVASGFSIKQGIDFASIPELGAPGVEGHGGQILLAEQAGVPVLIFAGRRHWYEGVGWDPIAFPVCLAKTMGAEGMVLTNSAGGINPGFRAGSVMMLDDHINLMGANPLVGVHHPFWGERFPDMSVVYDCDYRSRFQQVATRVGMSLEHGVYLAVSGPSYETPAEIRLFRGLGADAVGMSTVPEAILARAAGLRVLGVSCITNAAAGMGTALSHEEVLAGAKAAIPSLTTLLQQFVRDIGGSS